MKNQLIRKSFIALLIISSATFSGSLAYVYLSVLLGWVSGAMAAQWQMAFECWPLPVALAVPALMLSFYPRPALTKKYIIVSSIFIAFPIFLVTLVLLGFPV